MALVVSIIIPCYNSGNYLPDAIQSIEQYPDKSIYEVIIVDDGSTDQHTKLILNQLLNKGYNIIRQDNNGPAAARNTGVKHSKGEYILFLDSDNKIRDVLINSGIKILNENPEVAVVYGKPDYFGEVQEGRKWKIFPFDMKGILICNYIDMCSMIRKSLWLELNGLDQNRDIIGFEDWEFWIRTGKTDWKFYFIDEILYDYRISPGSLIDQGHNEQNYNKALKYIYGKHIDLVVKHMLKDYRLLYQNNIAYTNDKRKPLRSLIKFLYLRYFKN